MIFNRKVYEKQNSAPTLSPSEGPGKETAVCLGSLPGSFPRARGLSLGTG